MNTKPFHERSKDERREQVRPIFEKLTELKLTASEHDEIKELFQIISLSNSFKLLQFEFKLGPYLDKERLL